MNINSQICTSISQSERLLALGIKPETADMWRYKDGDGWQLSPVEKIWDEKAYIEFGTPAWSLHRLIEIGGNRISLRNMNIKFGILFLEDNLYDLVISRIERLIKGGTFNKEYLKEE